ncbi:hypothetical protein FRC07_007463, partial [Ceratobasidium sp. 392]
MPGHKKSASTKESKAPKPSAGKSTEASVNPHGEMAASTAEKRHSRRKSGSASTSNVNTQTNPTKDTSGRGKSSRHRCQSNPDPQQEQELGDKDAEYKEEDAAQTGDISMADSEPELPVPAPQFIVVGQPSQEATEIAVPRFKQVDVEGLSTERIFKMTKDETNSLSTKGKTNKLQANKKYCALEKYCLGVAVLNFACPFGGGTFVKIKNGVVHIHYNPQDLNDAHVKNLAQVFAMPEKKTNFVSLILTQIDPQHIKASCLEDMKHVCNIFEVAENPPL